MVRVGRNDPCPCGSGLRYKNCCLPHRGGLSIPMRLLLLLAGVLLLVAVTLVFVYHPGLDHRRAWYGEQNHPHVVP